MTQGRFPGVLCPSPVSALRAAMPRRSRNAFSLQRIFPATACARLGAPWSAPAERPGFEALDGGIFEKIAKHGPPAVDKSEVGPRKRTP